MTGPVGVTDAAGLALTTKDTAVDVAGPQPLFVVTLTLVVPTDGVNVTDCEVALPALADQEYALAVELVNVWV